MPIYNLFQILYLNKKTEKNMFYCCNCSLRFYKDDIDNCVPILVHMDYYNNVINLKVCSQKCEKLFYTKIEKIIKITKKHYKLYCAECRNDIKLEDDTEIIKIEDEKCISERIKGSDLNLNLSYKYIYYDLCEKCLS
jgi:hypothetical protein